MCHGGASYKSCDLEDKAVALTDKTIPLDDAS